MFCEKKAPEPKMSLTPLYYTQKTLGVTFVLFNNNTNDDDDNNIIIINFLLIIAVNNNNNNNNNSSSNSCDYSSNNFVLFCMSHLACLLHILTEGKWWPKSSMGVFHKRPIKYNHMPHLYKTQRHLPQGAKIYTTSSSNHIIDTANP